MMIFGNELRLPRAAALAVAITVLPLGAVAQDAQPEEATGRTDRELATSQLFMVAAANPLAVEAGYEVLKSGGTAIDAMIATQLVLNLVEPQSSGIGGGAFLLYYDAETKGVTVYDGRETAPMEADGTLFLGEDGEPLGFLEAVVGGRSVGTPGTLRLMEAAHQDHGALPWKGLFQSAIDLSEEGFEVSPRLAGLLEGSRAERLRTFATAQAYFFPGGDPLQAGDTLRNPEFAETLRLIADSGSEVFYSGEIARDIVATVRNAEGNPGLLSQADMEAYDIVRREPVCVTYRGNDV